MRPSGAVAYHDDLEVARASKISAFVEQSVVRQCQPKPRRAACRDNLLPWCYMQGCLFWNWIGRMQLCLLLLNSRILNSRILRTEEFEVLLLAWMCTVLEHGSLSTRWAIELENTYEKNACQSKKNQTTMLKKRRIQYVESNLTGMRLRNDGRDLHSSRDMFCKGSRPFAGKKIMITPTQQIWMSASDSNG